MPVTAQPTDFSTLVASLQAMTQVIGLSGKSLAAIAANAAGFADPVSVQLWTSGTTLSVTTGTLTAPGAGTAIALASGYSATVWQATNGGLTASLGGLVQVGFTASAPQVWGIGYLPMGAGASSTFTASMSVASSANLYLGVMAFFLPHG